MLKLCLTYFLWVTGFWGFSYWMPTVLKDVADLTGWVRQTTGSFAGALLYLAVSLTAAGLLILTLRRAPPGVRA